MLLTEFENIYRKVFDSIDNPSLEEGDLEQIIDSDCAITYNPNFFCIINRKNLDFEYISKNMHSCLEIPKSELSATNLNYIWDRIHPSDINCLYTSLGKLLSFIERLPEHHKEQFSYSWNYRFKKPDGTYINIIQNTTPFCVSENHSKQGLIRFQVVNSQYKMAVRSSLNLRRSNGDFKVVYSDNCSQSSFFKTISKREKDVIKLLAKENSSKSIAKQLFISSNTVDTHRRNILKKLKLSSTGELINILKTQKYMF